ncbi:hypothetical protein FVR03_20855 [Pontibacter qinzhouensis]|uniref:Glycosyltransferase RgtA/B/C/D-like domain-containing protein n=1 Tax=Pontibacter qinzhouensis TaxID=2603253 RepID=A0A5C8J2D2_9BACT|nr:hypothetical protein FVR03_20855 [Pontibacter qinzhouensis]
MNFYPALLLKLLAGVLLGLLYHHYYGAGDTITYHKASLRLRDYAFLSPTGYVRLILFNEFESEAFRSTVPFSANPGFSNSFYFIKMDSVLNLITGGNYYIKSLYYSLFSFCGAVCLVASLAHVFPGTKRAAVVAFLFFPTVVFWGSGLSKDSVLMGSMCWVVAFVLDLAHRNIKVLQVLLGLLMLYVFIRIKVFMAAALIGILAAYLLIQWLARFSLQLQRERTQLILLLSLTVGVGLLLMLSVGIFNPVFLFWQIVTSHDAILAQSLHGPHIQFHQLEPGWQGILINMPKAFFSAVYRPFLFESCQPLYLLLGAENFILLLLSMLSVASLLRRGSSWHMPPFYVALFLFVVLTAILTGLSTPNFGSLSRYRIIFMPFLVYLLLQSYYARELLQRVNSIHF